jgi:predicted kinase
MTAPTLLMLIGVPASGKSTWIKENCDPLGYNLLSTDNYIDSIASEESITYNEAFQKHIKQATTNMNKLAQFAFDNDRNVVWDQTNLTTKSRKSKLAMVPKHYQKIAMYFVTPNGEEHKRRLDSRTGKTIPYHILKNMIDTIEPPSYDEGFDKIIIHEN